MGKLWVVLVMVAGVVRAPAPIIVPPPPATVPTSEAQSSLPGLAQAFPPASPHRGIVVPAGHVAPVDAVVIDPFRPPPRPWMSGNRGLEYDTVSGQEVVASAAGQVSFAGQVGGRLFVTVRHSPELVTTVGFLERVDVSAGEWVRQGQALGAAGETLHFSARRNGEYIDPASLFLAVRIDLRLVPVPD